MLNKIKKISRLTIIAISILIVVGLVYYYEEIKEVEIEIGVTKVISAKVDIKENTIITEDMIYIDERFTTDIEKEKNKIILKKEDVIGKRTITPLYANETIKKDRVIENKPYMNIEDLKQIALELYANDKALDIQKSDYIDIWIEPVSQDEENEISSQLLFEKLYVIDIDNLNYLNVENTEKSEEKVPYYITIQLNNNDIQTLLNIDENNFNIRVSLYGKEKKQTVIKEVLQNE